MIEKRQCSQYSDGGELDRCRRFVKICDGFLLCDEYGKKPSAYLDPFGRVWCHDHKESRSTAPRRRVRPPLAVLPTGEKVRSFDYGRHPVWKEKRRQAIEASGGSCTVCGKPEDHSNLHIHHLTYDRFGHEFLEDLQVLCAACHNLGHEVTWTASGDVSKVPLVAQRICSERIASHEDGRHEEASSLLFRYIARKFPQGRSRLEIYETVLKFVRSGMTPSKILEMYMEWDDEVWGEFADRSAKKSFRSGYELGVDA